MAKKKSANKAVRQTQKLTSTITSKKPPSSYEDKQWGSWAGTGKNLAATNPITGRRISNVAGIMATQNKSSKKK